MERIFLYVRVAPSYDLSPASRETVLARLIDSKVMTPKIIEDMVSGLDRGKTAWHVLNKNGLFDE